jgi:glycosyltransferase involved in cell wall biosynthesis
MDLSIIIPIRNEEENIERLYNELVPVLKGTGKSYEIIMVDDGSSDSSFSIIKNLSVKDASVKAIKLKRNFGQTAAMACGIDCAEGDVLIFSDADLQNDPKDIPMLLAKLNENYDMVNGWRRNRKDALFTRKIPSMIANKIISIIGGVYLHDYGCTLRACKRQAFDNVKLYGEMHRFIPLLVSWGGARITEIEVNHRPRKFGRSKYGLMRTPKVLLDLLTAKFLVSFSTKPIYVFGTLGVFSLILGLVTSIIVFYRAFVLGRFEATPMIFFMGLFITTGIQFILMGFLAEMITRTYHESQNRPIYLIKEGINLKR